MAWKTDGQDIRIYCRYYNRDNRDMRLTHLTRQNAHQAGYSPNQTIYTTN